MRKQGTGIVYLVGGGPGDPGLITVRGLECLKQADVVVHDRLVNRFLLRFAPSAEWIDVGKQPSHHPVPQGQINDLLVEKALEGKVVVRLKGGDPFVFGRGGEEAEALAEHRLPFEIVPGITSAIAAPAYAGIPITHRGQSCSAVIITGHRADNCSDDPTENWRRAAQGADTLVYLMGVLNLPQIVQQAIAAGREPATPAAIIQRGSTSAQKTIVGTLETIVDLADGIRPPAIIIIGEVVKNREKIRWFDLPENRPLLGLKVLNTRPIFDIGEQDSNSSFGLDEFSHLLITNGAEPIELPVYRLSPACFPDKFHPNSRGLPSGNSTLPFDWIFFTHPAAVFSLLESLIQTGCDVRMLTGVKLAAVGEHTKKALLQKGLIADFVFSSDLEEFTEASTHFQGLRILLPEYNSSSRLLSGLSGSSIEFIPIPLYHAHPMKLDEELISELKPGKIDVAAFFSPEDFMATMDLLNHRDLANVLQAVTIACADNGTTQFVEKAGFKPEIIAESADVNAMVEAICRWREH